MKKLFKSTPKAPSPAASKAILDDLDPPNPPLYHQHAHASLRQQQQQQQATVSPASYRDAREREQVIAPSSSPGPAHALPSHLHAQSQALSAASDSPSVPHQPTFSQRHSLFYQTPNESWEVVNPEQGAPILSGSGRERDRSASVPALTGLGVSADTALELRPGLAQAQVHTQTVVPTQSLHRAFDSDREAVVVSAEVEQASARPTGSQSPFINTGSALPLAHNTLTADQDNSSPSTPAFTNPFSQSPTSTSHPPTPSSITLQQVASQATSGSAPAMLKKKTPSNNSNSSVGGASNSAAAGAGQILRALEPSMFGGLGGGSVPSPVSSSNTTFQTQTQIQRERDRERDYLLQQQHQQQWIYAQQQQQREKEVAYAQQKPGSRNNLVQQNSRPKAFIDSSTSKLSKSKSPSMGLGDKLRRSKSTRRNRDSLSDIEFGARDDSDLDLDDFEHDTGSVDHHHTLLLQQQHPSHSHPQMHAHQQQHQPQQGFYPHYAEHGEYDPDFAYDSPHTSAQTNSNAIAGMGTSAGLGPTILRRPSTTSSFASAGMANPGMPGSDRRTSWVGAPSPYPPSSGGSMNAIVVNPRRERDMVRGGEGTDWEREARWRDADVDGSNASTLKSVEASVATNLKDGRTSKSLFDRLKDGVAMDWEGSEHSHRDPNHERTRDREREKERDRDRDRERDTERRDRKDGKEGKEDWWATLFSKDKDKANEKKSGKKGESAFDKFLHPHQQSQAPAGEHVSSKGSHQQANVLIKDKDRGERERDREKEAKEAKAGLANAGFIPSALGGGDKSDQCARMVGMFVTPRPGSSDVNWALALDLCERTSDPEAAKGVAKALRKELKYAGPGEQLGAATLWAIMLQNASSLFITQTCSRKFLDVVEYAITQGRIPLLRERLLEILGAAVFISGPGASEQDKNIKDKEWAKRDNFRSLWRKVKPEWAPDEGMPLSTDNPMFQPHYTAFATSAPDARGRQHLTPDAPDRERDRSSRKRSSCRKGEETQIIIPVDEDMRRLFQECKIGRGNAALLCEALAFATPEDLKRKELIKEFHQKCIASLDLVHAQIPWATAGAERSRQRELELGASLPLSSLSATNTPDYSPSPSPGPQPNTERNSGVDQVTTTKEEKLLAELLRANEELADALRIYSDIERIGKDFEAEKAAKERSRVEIRGNANQVELQSVGEGSRSASFLAPSVDGSGSRSQSPSDIYPIQSQPSHPGVSHNANQMRFDSFDGQGQTQLPIQHQPLPQPPVQQNLHPSILQPGNASFAQSTLANPNWNGYIPQQPQVQYEPPYHATQVRFPPHPGAENNLSHTHAQPLPSVSMHGHAQGHGHTLSQTSIQSPTSHPPLHQPAPNNGTLTGPRQLRGPRSPLPIPGQYTHPNRDSVVSTPATPNVPLSSAANFNQIVNGLQNVQLQSQHGHNVCVNDQSRTPSPAPPSQLSRPSSLILPNRPASANSRSHSRAGSLDVSQQEYGSTANSNHAAGAFGTTPALNFSHVKANTPMPRADYGFSTAHVERPQISDKAAGKRKMVESLADDSVDPQHTNSIPPSPAQHPPNLPHPPTSDTFNGANAEDHSARSIQLSQSSSSDSDSDSDSRWGAAARRRRKTQYVYDAAAERARERVRELQREMQMQQQVHA